LKSFHPAVAGLSHRAERVKNGLLALKLLALQSCSSQRTQSRIQGGVRPAAVLGEVAKLVRSECIPSGSAVGSGPLRPPECQ
jgi:hypothetical protein